MGEVRRRALIGGAATAVTAAAIARGVPAANAAALWGQGVKFASHYTGGTACSPARAALVTGLYPHQNWCLQARKGQNAGAAGPNAPALQCEFPTYVRIMRESGYRTPYVGKWHLSDSPPEASSSAAPFYLSDYGFEGLMIPDPIGTNGQGTQDDGYNALFAGSGATPAVNYTEVPPLNQPES